VTPREEMPPLYRVLDALHFREFLRRIYRIQVVGAEHIPARGGVILASNHESLFDPWLLAVATTRPIRYMAKRELWRYPLVGRAMDAFGTFPIQRGAGDRTAMSRGADLLRAGAVLGVFPQGTARPFRRRPFQRGAAKLALTVGCPLVPVCLIGSEKVLRPNKPKVGLPAVQILIAPPIEVAANGRPTIPAAKALTQQLEATITELRRPFGPPVHVWLD
jgi:1-acyl-sn-glycerol-3-phosphate acyltransferase